MAEAPSEGESRTASEEEEHGSEPAQDSEGEAFEEELQQAMLQRVEQMLYGNSGLPIQAPKEPEPYWPGESMGDQWWKEEDPKSPTTPNSEAAPGVVSQSSRKEDSSQSEASSGEEANTAPVDTSAVAKAVELAQQLRQEAEDAAQKRRQNRRKNEDTRASELGLARDASWAFHLCCLDVAKASPGRI